MSDKENIQPRIKSFVRRVSRITKGQQQALTLMWPVFGIEYKPGLLDFTKIFNNSNPLVLEIGFGNGESLIEQAKKTPELNFVGVEVHKPGVGRLLQLIDEYKLTNVRVFCHDAIDVLHNCITPNSLARIQLFFPDPWHKKRHNKRRIVNEEFLSLAHKCLQFRGILHMATDWQPYAEHMLQAINSSKLFKNLAKNLSYFPKPHYRPNTKFEQRGNKLGHDSWDILALKV
jgi:tRNA (guanine-N7-)-methyltransferase